MNNTVKPLALSLADALEQFHNAYDKQAATELRRLYSELNQWKSVFGHLGTADECGNEWNQLRDENEDHIQQLRKEQLEVQRLSEAHEWQYKMAGDRLRRIEKLEAENEKLRKIMRVALDALENSAVKHPQQIQGRDEAISRLREVLFEENND
jgi:uncharacterized protein (DUF2249 family)